MRRLLLFLLVSTLTVSCKPKPHPTPADSVSVIDTTDSVGTDSTLLDQAEVYDTTGALDVPNEGTLDSLIALKRPRAGVANTGIGYGMTNWPTSAWCNGPLTILFIGVTPSSALKSIQAAANCGLRVIFVPNRPLITIGGTVHSPFSPIRANKFSSDLCKVLTPSVLYTYRRTIVGMNLADDYGSKEQWGGTVVTQAEIGNWAAYTRQVCGYNLPLGIRVEPTWSNNHPEVYKRVDYAWAQYRKYKGDVNTYYAKQGSLAKAQGLDLVKSINIAECGAQASPPCTPSELQTFGSVMINSTPYGCAFPHWKYDEYPSTWTAGQQTVHRYFINIVKARPWSNCTTKGPMATSLDGGGDTTATDTTPAPDTAPTVAATAETSAVPPGHRKRH